MSASGPTGLYGKIPSQADFLRLNASDPAALALARWLEEGNEALHRIGGRLPSAPIGFLFRAAEGDHALIGVLGPGTDKVGRSFPLAVFAPVPAHELAGSFPLLPALHRPFLAAARALVESAAQVSAPELAERLRRLPSPDATEAGSARVWAQEASGELVGDWRRRLFPDLPEGQPYYAVHTFQVACRPARGKDLSRPGLALDCPCTREADAWTWLELARRRLGWPRPPAFFWREGDRPALVVALGAPPPAVLVQLSTAPRDGRQIWPLRTQHAPAVTAARQALSSTQLAALDGSRATIEELLASLVP